MDDLIEKNRSLDRECSAANREARIIQEMVVDLKDKLHREKEECDRNKKVLHETKANLAEQKVTNETLKSTVEALNKELQTAAEQYKNDLATFAKGQDGLLNQMKQEHAGQRRNLEKAIADLQRANASLENERSKLQRDAQTFKQRCLALEKSNAEKESEHQETIKVLTGRALDAEALLDATLFDQKDLKANVLSLEERLRENDNAKEEMRSVYNKTTAKIRDELVSAKRENDSFSVHCQQLQNELEETRRQIKVEKEKMMSDAKQQIADAKLECESMRVSRSAEQLKAKEAKTLHDKAVSLHESTVEQMKMDANDARLLLEKTISDERNVSQASITTNALFFFYPLILNFILFYFHCKAFNVKGAGARPNGPRTNIAKAPIEDEDEGDDR